MEIKIYVANLGKYNEGELVGSWFTLPVDMDEVSAKIGLNEQYEEYAIHDYEAPFKINEYDDIEDLNEIAEAFNRLDDVHIKAASALVDNGISKNMEDAVSMLQDVHFYHGVDSMEDIAYAWHEETGTDMNAPLMGYVDWEAVGRDMEIEGTFIKLEYGLWIEYFG